MSALREAYKLLKHQDNWCTGAVARDGEGKTAHPQDEEAVRWCAQGAVARYSRPGEFIEAYLTLEDAAAEHFRIPLASVNDHLGRQAVLTLFEKVLADEDEGIPL